MHDHFHTWRWLSLALMCLCTSLAMADTVRLSTTTGVGSIKVTGQVIDYTGSQIVIERTTGQQSTYPSIRVEQVDTNWPEELGAGRAAAADGDHRKAIGLLTSATRADDRPWVRRIIMAELMQAYMTAGDVATASELLVALANSDPQTPAIDAGPLAWFATQAVPPAKVEAWLATADSPVVQLLGASHAMSTSRRGEALAVLAKLKRSDDSRIAFLATAQSWRGEMITASSAEVERWEKQTGEARESVRAGGWFVIGQTWARLGEHDRAALAYLHVPIEHAGQRQLAARALLGATEVMLAAGHRDDALKIARQIRAHYAETPPANQVELMLQSPAGN